MAEQMHHTPGPWRVVEKGQGWDDSWREIWAGNHAVVRADGYYSSKYDGYEFGVAISEPNARRIVACVNACEGIPTEALESGLVRELIEAAERALFALENCVPERLLDDFEVDAIERLRTVLAKARGEA